MRPYSASDRRPFAAHRDGRPTSRGPTPPPPAQRRGLPPEAGSGGSQAGGNSSRTPGPRPVYFQRFAPFTQAKLDVAFGWRDACQAQSESVASVVAKDLALAEQRRIPNDQRFCGSLHGRQARVQKRYIRSPKGRCPRLVGKGAQERLGCRSLLLVIGVPVVMRFCPPSPTILTQLAVEIRLKA